MFKGFPYFIDLIKSSKDNLIFYKLLFIYLIKNILILNFQLF